jgi:hypothetical protein
MKLRFVEGIFEHGKFQLEYFDEDLKIWCKVPCVKAEERCDHAWILNTTKTKVCSKCSNETFRAEPKKSLAERLREKYLNTPTEIDPTYDWREVAKESIDAVIEEIKTFPSSNGLIIKADLITKLRSLV